MKREFEIIINKILEDYPEINNSKIELDKSPMSSKIDLIHDFLNKVKREYSNKDKLAREHFELLMNSNLEFINSDSTLLKEDQEFVR